MKKLKAVIFDLDGTLANTLPMCIKAFRHAIEPLAGRSVADAEIIATFGLSEEGTILALAPDSYDKGVAAYLKHYVEFHDMCPAPFDGMVAILEKLRAKGIRLAMVTGKGMASAKITLEKYAIWEYFEIVEAGMPEGNRKPEGIQAILDIWAGIAKDEVIYVGDAPSDIISCRKAGIPIAAAAWAETAEPELLIPLQPDVLFYDIPSFDEWLNKQTNSN